MGTLYVIATPIGNLEDITLRALRLLGEVDLIAAEDTRKARLLLNRHNIKNRLTSYYEQNKRSKLPKLIQLLLEGKSVALISEAGMPGLNDPGYELINAAIGQNIPVVPIPGPSVITTALVVSGLPTDQFIYIGYLPRRRNDRKRLLQSLTMERRTIICLETPHRLQASLTDMAEALGDRRVAVCRELTKIHEEVFHGTLSQALKHFCQPKGEFTLIIEGASKEKQKAPVAEAEKLLQQFRSQGLGAKESVLRVTKTLGIPRREAYRLWLKQIETCS
jgi:16S rRNA (cytidine1402-2'-O)-methyltransferase